ncbi:MAG: hypothetical protein PHR28_02855 [candidate division Zixibacteria bacterium]|nr:hypothetical protein [candidate division Zixibacteria bacterium]
MRTASIHTTAILLILVCLGVETLAGGGGQARIGYVLLDEDGNLGVNQETFNTYEGPSFSLDNFRYLTASGLNIFANLQSITLNNRNLRAGVFKPGMFTASVYNNQYRRAYSFDGGKFTRRNVVGGQFECMPSKYAHFFGGFDLTKKHGDRTALYEFRNDTVIIGTDYTQSAFNFGAQTFWAGGTLRLEYRAFDFSDDLAVGGDRDARQFTATAFMPVPRYNRVTVSGGYDYRRDRHDWSNTELTTHTGWGGARALLPLGWSLDGRFLFARTKHSLGSVETDNVVTTVAAGRAWPRYGGVRLGYENRISDDLVDRTTANAVMAAGWVKMNDKLSARGRFSTRLKRVKTGATLLGDEDVTRFQVSVRYQDTLYGDMSLRYQGRIRTNDDIDTRVEYNAVTAALNTAQKRYGTLAVTYSYYIGMFENRSGPRADRFEFADHVVSGTLQTVTWRKIRGTFGGTYYRSHRDCDVEKFGLLFGARYELPSDVYIDATYQAVNYDNFLVTDQYYTGNIVTVNVIKGFTL